MAKDKIPFMLETEKISENLISSGRYRLLYESTDTGSFPMNTFKILSQQYPDVFMKLMSSLKNNGKLHRDNRNEHLNNTQLYYNEDIYVPRFCLIDDDYNTISSENEKCKWYTGENAIEYNGHKYHLYSSYEAHDKPGNNDLRINDFALTLHAISSGVCFMSFMDNGTPATDAKRYDIKLWGKKEDMIQLEPDFVPLITGHDKDSYNRNELVAILKQMREDGEASTKLRLFGIIYAPHIGIDGISTSDIAKEATGFENNGREIDKGRALGLYLRQYIHKETSAISRHSAPLDFSSMLPRQIIYYGAPGTGKSHTIKEEEKRGTITCIRTTFHPDSDYSSFVGCYKPHCNKDRKELTYEFVEQAFLEAYKMAWTNPGKEVALVIEEINRGNCAQVFGDIFQLLDRDEDGWSTYPIKADTDISDHLEELAIPGYSETMAQRFGEEKAGYGFLALPPNMSLLATMNTSDQSLFPIDSAFKRRWDWKYIPICQGKNDEDGSLKEWTIETTTKEKSWWTFLRSINTIIEQTTKSEDKELGFYFTKADNSGVITADKFVNKVVFYLWTDVFKTYGFRSDIFNKDADGKEKLTFKDFYLKDGSINHATVSLFIDNVVKHLPNVTTEENPETGLTE